MRHTLAALAVACLPAREAPEIDALAAECVPYSTSSTVDTYLARRSAAYVAAIARARAWMDTVELDPVALPHHVKPKKKLVELLDGYLRLYHVGAGDRAELLGRLEQLAASTDDDAYHDMLDVDDTTFKQNSTSYLRAAYLLEGVGIGMPGYRAEIARVQPRLDAHLGGRGPHQRAAFRTYYAHFGLKAPIPLEGSLEDGLIARRAPAADLDKADTYTVTHEIFIPYDYGDDLDASPFDEGDLRYLRSTLATLTERYIAKEDPDLVAELISCMRYIRATDLPQYVGAIQYLLDSQQPDGRWGDYERFRPHEGDLVTVKYELHTTMVAIDALTIAFHPEWNQAVAPIRP